MRLYLTAKTNIPDVIVDFIEVQLNTGKTVSLNWDESDISRSSEGFSARYKGVYFGEEYANGRLADLEGLKITDVGLYFEAEGSFHFQIEEMEFDDNGKELVVGNPVIPPDCDGLSNLAKTSLDAQIQSASTRAGTSVQAPDMKMKDLNAER